MNIADILVIIVFGLLALRGYLRGFVVSIIRTFSLIISLVLAKLFHVQFAHVIFGLFPGLRSAVYKGVHDFVIGSLPDGGGGGIDFSALLKIVAPDLANSIPQDLKVGDNVIELMKSSKEVNIAVETLTSQISTFVINCISFVALFALISVSIEVLIFVINKARKLPIIGTFDSMLGAFLGVIQAWLVLSVVFFVVVNVNNAGIMKDFAQQIESSLFARILLDFSIVQQMVKSVMEITAKTF